MKYFEKLTEIFVSIDDFYKNLMKCLNNTN